MAVRRPAVDLAALLAQCEGNYRRLALLLPERRPGAVRTLAVAGTGLQYRLTVLECSPYTSLLAIRQQGQPAWLPALTMEVRLYHDAAVAEVISCQGYRRIRSQYPYPNPAMHQPDEKLRLGAFLADWLAFCLRHGEGVAECMDA